MSNFRPLLLQRRTAAAPGRLFTGHEGVVIHPHGRFWLTAGYPFVGACPLYFLLFLLPFFFLFLLPVSSPPWLSRRITAHCLASVCALVLFGRQFGLFTLSLSLLPPCHLPSREMCFCPGDMLCPRYSFLLECPCAGCRPQFVLGGEFTGRRFPPSSDAAGPA